MRCIICNKEIEGGFIVERECVEALKAENEKLRAHIAELKTLEEKQDHLLTINGNGEIKKLETVILTCPKCGSENVSVERRPDGFCKCLACGFKWQRERKLPELTTAEKWLWLGENTMYCLIDNDLWSDDYSRAIKLTYCRNGRVEKKTIYVYKSFAEAIDAAYDWAKEQEK